MSSHSNELLTELENRFILSNHRKLLGAGVLMELKVAFGLENGIKIESLWYLQYK